MEWKSVVFAPSFLLTSERVDIIVPGKSRLFRKPIPDNTLSFTWQEVTSISAFKRDCFTIDLICMIFELNQQTTIELNENMAGWKNLIEIIPQQLPDALTPDEWFSKVAFPAFKTCWTQIYSRNPISAEAGVTSV